eukprot:13934715-Ditylum_brightwellii.AAC.1
MRTCFPNKVPTRIMGDPDYESINALKMELYANVGAVPTPLGGGTHGYVSLIMNDALYQRVTTATYTPLTKPIRTAPRTGATATEKETAKKKYKEDMIVFNNHTTMAEMLKTYIQDAVEYNYLRPIKKKYSGYLGVGARDMMNHLIDHYGKITPADIVNNNTKFQEGIAMDQPIDAYFLTINDCVQYASNIKATYTVEQIMVNVEMPSARQLYREALINWKAKAPADKTWDNFKKFFVDEYHTLKEDKQAIACMAEYHQANISEQIYEVSDAIEQLVLAAVTDKRTIEKLATADTDLAKANKQLTKEVQEIKII